MVYNYFSLKGIYAVPLNLKPNNWKLNDKHPTPNNTRQPMKMLSTGKRALTYLAVGLFTVLSAGLAHSQEVLNFYNWSDYIAEDTISKFEKETGIKVNYDVYDSSETLEAKLLAGHSGYDLVVPSSGSLERHIKAKIYQPLDKSKLPNLKNMNPSLMKAVESQDIGNKHSVPYLWGTTGIGYNVEKVKAILGKDAPVNSWDLVFKPEYVKKLMDCGVSLLDSPDEIYPLALNYVGQTSSRKTAHYKKTSKAGSMLKSIRPYVTQFHSSAYINNLANGEICVAVGYSGDILQAQARAIEAKNGVKIEYSIPDEGTAVWFDMLTIPRDAKNPDAAHKFINFLMRPDIIADITNYVAYANPNLKATKLQDPEISNNPAIYPSQEVMKRLFTLGNRKKKLNKMLTRLWTDLKAGR